MRLLYGLPLLLVCAALAQPAAAGPLDDPPYSLMTSRPFAAAPRAGFTLGVNQDGFVQVTITLRDGDFDGFSLQGPGSCTATRSAQAGSSVTVACGWVTAGSHRLVLTMDGLGAQGTIRAKGAYFSPAPGV